MDSRREIFIGFLLRADVVEIWVGRGGYTSAFRRPRASGVTSDSHSSPWCLSSTRTRRDRSCRLIFALGREDHPQQLGQAEAGLAQLRQSLAVRPVRIVALQRDRPAAFGAGLRADRRARPDIDHGERAAGEQERLGRPLRGPGLGIARRPRRRWRSVDDHLAKTLDRPIAYADEPHRALHRAAVPVGMQIAALADLEIVT